MGLTGVAAGDVKAGRVHTDSVIIIDLDRFVTDERVPLRPHKSCTAGGGQYLSESHSMSDMGSEYPVPSRAEVAAVVKWFNPTKGFGFVKPTDGSPDAFLHVSVLLLDCADREQGFDAFAARLADADENPGGKGNPGASGVGQRL